MSVLALPVLSDGFAKLSAYSSSPQEASLPYIPVKARLSQPLAWLSSPAFWMVLLRPDL